MFDATATPRVSTLLQQLLGNVDPRDGTSSISAETMLEKLASGTAAPVSS